MKPRKKQSPEKDTGNVYDRIFKQLMNELALPIVNRFLGLNLQQVQRLPDKQHSVVEREPDFLCMVTDEAGETFILHIEFQTKQDPKMLARMKEYHGLIYRMYELPIRHLVFYFGTAPPRMPNRLKEDRIFTGFEIVHFKEQSYETFLESEHCNEILLAVLADFKDNSEDSVVEAIVKQLQAKSQSEKELKGYFNRLNILSRLRNLQEITVKITTAMPIAYDITKDSLYKQGLQRGSELGFRQGEEKGIIKGKAEGKAEGKVQEDLTVLCRMAQEQISYSIICRISNAPEAFLKAFLKSYSPEKGEQLLGQIGSRDQHVSGVESLKKNVLQALKNFGIPTKVANAYLDWLIQ